MKSTVASRAPQSYRAMFGLLVIVAALGYFVDIYDLLLFGIVRIPSLTALGLNSAQVSTVGTTILNWQMGGLLLGGIDFCRRWPGMEMFDKTLMGETIDSVTAFAVLHDVAAGVAQQPVHGLTVILYLCGRKRGGSIR